MFFNTINAQGRTLIGYEIKAEKQEDLIAEFFKNNPGQEITPEDVINYHPAFKQTPITSVRRAFTNLAAAAEIFKTDNQIDGMYGMPIHTWKKNQP